MIKVGLIGEDIAGIFLDDYPLKVEKLALINGEGSLDQVLTGKDLSAFLDLASLGLDMPIPNFCL